MLRQSTAATVATCYIYGGASINAHDSVVVTLNGAVTITGVNLAGATAGAFHGTAAKVTTVPPAS